MWSAATSGRSGVTGWQLAGIYTDEGITGTSTKHRAGFQRMIADALAGNIDLIITKSVSRFARNTVDSLTTVRSLKEAGVEVYFEKENIWTLDSKGELLITIMSSLAQEESRSISENVTWGHRKRFADGKAMIPYASLLGYKRGEEGTMVIDETQAPTVRLIYNLFLAGKSIREIAAHLEAEGLLTPMAKTRWSVTTIRSILSNERYKGDVLLQKTFVADFLTKTVKRNEGEVAQYYVTGHHEPIIAPAVWDQVVPPRVGVAENHHRPGRVGSGAVRARHPAWHRLRLESPPVLVALEVWGLWGLVWEEDVVVDDEQAHRVALQQQTRRR